ncbi:hypothetical protein [Mangrovibacterium lignilyticum]|nr:hypothetical protein [Mangrovibacterium lignilyticum]
MSKLLRTGFEIGFSPTKRKIRTRNATEPPQNGKIRGGAEKTVEKRRNS